MRHGLDLRTWVCGLSLFGSALFGAAPAGAQPVEVSQPPSPEPDGSDEKAANADDQQVVVTGTRTVRLRRDSPVRTDVIGEAVLRNAGARNLADALEYLPGARAESNCQNCNTTEVQLLGLPGAYNQILLDGLPLVSGVASVYGVEQIPSVLVDRVEVVKGGASALYGPGAVAGVVNVLPVRPVVSGIRAHASANLLRGQVSPSGALLGSLGFGGEGGMATLYGQREDSPAVDFDGDGYSELARRKLTVAGARARAGLGESMTLDLAYQFTTEFRRGGNHFGARAHLANVAEEIASDIHRASAALTRTLGERASATAVYALARVDRRSFYGGLGAVETDPEAPGFDSDALAKAAVVSSRQYGRTDDVFHFVEARGELTAGAHALLAGVQFRHEDVDDRNLDAGGRTLGTLARGAFSTVGAFVQDEWTLSESLKLVLGGRVDKSSELGAPILSPRAALWFSPGAALVLRANYSTGFRAPEVFSEDLHVDVLGARPVRVVNAPGLRPERAQSYSLGFDLRPDWAGGAFTLDGQAYLTELTDTFFLGDVRDGPDGGLFQLRRNAGGSRVLGAELSATARVAETLRLVLGGAYLRARYDRPQLVYEDGARRIFTRDYLKSPRLAGVAQALWDVTPSLDAFLAFKFTGRSDVLNNRTGELVRAPRFLVADASLTRHLPLGGPQEADITLGVRNITDSRQRDLETGAARDSDYVYGPRQPRTVFLRLSAHY